MKTRSKTLLTNVAIYVSIVVIAGINVLYWKTYVGKSRAELSELAANIERFKAEKAAKVSELEKTNVTKRNFEEETEKRRQELASYGDFLRKESERPESIEKLQVTIEKAGIQIMKAAFNPLAKGDGNYSVFNFTMELEGPYVAFKRLLALLPREEQIYRIQAFDVLNYDNTRHNWEVRLALETYFSRQG